jgi:hypothetical protein
MKFSYRQSRNVLTYDSAWHLTHGTCPCSGDLSLVLSLDGSQRKYINAQILQNVKYLVRNLRD